MKLYPSNLNQETENNHKPEWATLDHFNNYS